MVQGLRRIAQGMPGQQQLTKNSATQTGCQQKGGPRELIVVFLRGLVLMSVVMIVALEVVRVANY